MDRLFRAAQVVFSEGAIPPSAAIAGSDAQQPAGTLFPVGDDIGEVPHDPMQVLAMYVREKTRFE